jgi:hypothetical protein
VGSTIGFRGTVELWVIRRHSYDPLRKRMLEELQRRNYAQVTIDHYIQIVEDFAKHFASVMSLSLANSKLR